MQPNFSQDLLSSDRQLCHLEEQLQKKRSSLIQNYNRGVSNSNRTLYGSYYPMLEKYTGLAEQYVMELANFKKVLQALVQLKDSSNEMDIINNTSNGMESNNNNNNNENVNIVNNNNTPREFATINNGNYKNSNVSGSMDESKQKESITQAVNDENETKLSSLFHNDQTVTEQTQPQPQTQTQIQTQPQQRRKPPVKNNNSHMINNHMINNVVNNKNNNNNNNNNITVMSTNINVNVHVNNPKIMQLAPKKPRNRQILVARHKYRHNDKEFQIFWKRNFQRPMYTLSTLKINKTFSGNEKAVKKFLYEKGGFKPELIEQITFIGGGKQTQRNKTNNNRNNNNNNKIDFTLVRYRASLTYIYSGIHRVDENESKGLVIKQNNRSKKNQNNPSKKLYVNNFDVLDKNCHSHLTNIFSQFGELERDIFIGKDKKTRNPWAKIEFREIGDAITCMNTHNHFKTTIYFPPRINQFDDANKSNTNGARKFLNRKLNIEYNIQRDNNVKSRNKNRNNTRR